MPQPKWPSVSDKPHPNPNPRATPMSITCRSTTRGARYRCTHTHTLALTLTLAHALTLALAFALTIALAGASRRRGARGRSTLAAPSVRADGLEPPTLGITQSPRGRASATAIHPQAASARATAAPATRRSRWARASCRATAYTAAAPPKSTSRYGAPTSAARPPARTESETFGRGGHRCAVSRTRCALYRLGLSVRMSLENTALVTYSV